MGDEHVTPGRGERPTDTTTEPAAPAEFGRVQVWWGDGKGTTTAALGMAFRAADHGYRVYVLRFMKGGADSVEAVRGEYSAFAAGPGNSRENLGHFGWHALDAGIDDRDHVAQARADLVTRVHRERHPFDPGQHARNGTEYVIACEHPPVADSCRPLPIVAAGSAPRCGAAGRPVRRLTLGRNRTTSVRRRATDVRRIGTKPITGHPALPSGGWGPHAPLPHVLRRPVRPQQPDPAVGDRFRPRCGRRATGS